MKNLLKNPKLTGAIVVVLALGGVAYYYWGAGGSSSPVASSLEEPVASQDLLTTLGNLRSIQLNDALFRDPLFVSLSDFGVTIPPAPVGRRNPFDPVGGGQIVQ